MYVFRDEHLGLDKLSGLIPGKEWIFSQLSFIANTFSFSRGVLWGFPYQPLQPATTDQNAENNWAWHAHHDWYIYNITPTLKTSWILRKREQEDIENRGPGHPLQDSVFYLWQSHLWHLSVSSFIVNLRLLGATCVSGWTLSPWITCKWLSQV